MFYGAKRVINIHKEKTPFEIKRKVIWIPKKDKKKVLEGRVYQYLKMAKIQQLPAYRMLKKYVKYSLEEALRV